MHFCEFTQEHFQFLLPRIGKLYCLIIILSKVELASLRNLVAGLNLTCAIVDIPQQVEDAHEGKFGNVYRHRPEEQSVGISQARTMVQYYVGQMMLDTPHSIGWILDDDMAFDRRAFHMEIT